MLEAALTWYKKFKGDLESIGFVFNPYAVCVANKMVNGKQHTIRFHVDDILGRHVDLKVNDEFLKWLNETYGGHRLVVGNRLKRKIHGRKKNLVRTANDKRIASRKVESCQTKVRTKRMKM